MILHLFYENKSIFENSIFCLDSDKKSLLTFFQTFIFRRQSGSVLECLTRDRGVLGSILTSVTALCSLARHIDPSLVLDQPRKTHPFITEKLLLGRKESNQTNKNCLISADACYPIQAFREAQKWQRHVY